MYSLAEATGAPRTWRALGVPYLVNRLTPRAYGLQRAFLEDAAPGEPYGSEAATAALLGTPDGRAVFAFGALYRHNPGMSLARAAELVEAGDLDELVRLHLMRRPRAPRAEGSAEPAPPDWGATLARLFKAGLGTWAEILDMTFDEIDCRLRGGDDPDDDVSPAQFLEMCAAAGAGASESDE